MNSKTYTLPNGKKAVFEYDVCGIGRITLECMDELMSMITAPSIDIVRCKECKWEQRCQKAVQHTTHELTSVTIGYKAVEFCSYGERKDNEAD